MFLLIPFAHSIEFFNKPCFTFHNVSINTVRRTWQAFRLRSFTFHNVSINTFPEVPDPSFRLPLHSTMFLLIHPISYNRNAVKTPLHSTMFLLIRWNRWTNVNSVSALHSTMFLLIRDDSGWVWSRDQYFTFHNVSINTISGDCHPSDCYVLYIPQCFY